MKGKSSDIPDGHHFARYCAKARTIRKDGAIVGVYPALFSLRPPKGDRPQEGYLSGSYWEYFAAPDANRKTETQAAIPLEKRNGDCLALLCAQRLRKVGAETGLSVKVLHSPSKSNPAYAKVTGTPKDETHSFLASAAKAAVVTLVAL